LLFALADKQEEKLERQRNQNNFENQKILSSKNPPKGIF